jgi:hypothetical protein
LFNVAAAALKALEPYDRTKEENPEARAAGRQLIAEGQSAGPNVHFREQPAGGKCGFGFSVTISGRWLGLCRGLKAD